MSASENPIVSGATRPRTEISDEFSWVYEVISALRYKPGSQFGFLAKESGVLEFTFSMEVFDAKNVTRKTNIVIRELLHEGDFVGLSFDDCSWRVVNLFALMVSRFEQHEVAEWLTFNGKYITEPHPHDRG